MKVQLKNDDGDTLTMERDLDGNLVIQHKREGVYDLSQFVVERAERVKLSEMVEAL